MSKWSLLSVLLCASLISSSMFGQWTQAGGAPLPPSQYPQSQYPDAGQQAQGYPQDQPQAQQPQAPQAPDPADLQHGVARVSIAQGDVNITRGDNGQLSGAVINTPLVARDHLETSGGSRAEVQLDAVTLLRLAPNTDVGFADLQYHRAQIQLGLGTVIFRVLQNSPMQVEIDTPSVGFRALGPGEYRISVFDNGTSQISVHSGQGELSAPRGTERLDAGHSVMVRGDASNPEMQDVADGPRDQFDEWNAGRDQQILATQSTQYVNTDVQGASDLDHYGNWVGSGYGQVWQPQGVPPDWSPYSNGQWSYVDYYGWSWIDYSPWGWAPYHYGRWFYNPGYGWCWWPGARLYPAYYSPALVGFFGFGVGLGWVALAPFEFFHPWWGIRAGFGFRGGYGIGAYRNSGFRGGIITASLNGFAGPHQHFGFATRSQLAGAIAISGRLPVTNIRAGMNFSSRAAVPNARFASVQSRSFYNSGFTNRSSPARSFNSTPRPAARSYPAAGGNSNAGWHSFGSPGATAPRAAAPRQSYQASENSGWHSFGQPAAGSNGYRAATPPATHYGIAPRSYSQPSSQQPRSSYSAPRQYYSAPAPRQSYSAPAPRQAAPRTSAPAAPHTSGGGGGGHISGGGGHSSGGGGHHGR